MWMSWWVWPALTLPRECPESELSIWGHGATDSAPGPLLAPPAPEVESDISPDLKPPTGRSKLTATMTGAKTKAALGALSVPITRKEVL